MSKKYVKRLLNILSNKGIHSDPKSLAAFGPGDARRYGINSFYFTKGFFPERWCSHFLEYPSTPCRIRKLQEIDINSRTA